MNPVDRAMGELQSLLDGLQDLPLPQRLAAVQRLKTHAYRLLVRERDSIAYQARQQWAGADVQALSGIERARIEYWAKCHRERTGAAAIGRKERVDVSGGVDLSGGSSQSTS